MVTKGLEEGDRIFLSVPEGLEDKDFRLLPEMNGKRKKKEGSQEEKPGDKIIPAVPETSAKADPQVTKVAKKKS